MKALEITEPGKARLIDKPEPTPGAGEVLLRINTVGYCGTDLSTFRGRNPLVQYPRVPGHEIGATVAAVGDGVEDWREGDTALVFPYTDCPDCSSCLAGRPNCCTSNQTLGVQREGLMAELAVVPAKTLIRAPGLSTAELALVEPLTVGAHAVARGQVQAGEAVAVIGCGAIGLGAIAAAARVGAYVIAIDIDDGKLEVGRACGAKVTINSLSTDVAKRLANLTSGHGPAVVIEAVGLPQTFRGAVDWVAFAGRVVYIGYAKQPVDYETKFFVMKELDIRGSRNALRDDFAFVIDMLSEGGVPTEKVITHHANLENAAQAIADWDANPGEVTKIHVQIGAGLG